MVVVLCLSLITLFRNIFLLVSRLKHVLLFRCLIISRSSTNYGTSPSPPFSHPYAAAIFYSLFQWSNCSSIWYSIKIYNMLGSRTGEFLCEKFIIKDRQAQQLPLYWIDRWSKKAFLVKLNVLQIYLKESNPLNVVNWMDIFLGEVCVKSKCYLACVRDYTFYKSHGIKHQVFLQYIQ